MNRSGSRRTLGRARIKNPFKRRRRDKLLGVADAVMSGMAAASGAKRRPSPSRSGSLPASRSALSIS